MFGYKNGCKSGRKYPTTENVLEQFYLKHPDASQLADVTAGELRRVKVSTFRHVHYNADINILNR